VRYCGNPVAGETSAGSGKCEAEEHHSYEDNYATPRRDNAVQYNAYVCAGLRLVRGSFDASGWLRTCTNGPVYEPRPDYENENDIYRAEIENFDERYLRIYGSADY